MANWIQGAHLRKGAFTKKAKAAGMSVAAYAQKVHMNPSGFSSKTVHQANLARTLKKLGHR